MTAVLTPEQRAHAARSREFTDETRRLVRAAQAAVYRELPAPSTLPPDERRAARQRLTQRLAEVEREVWARRRAEWQPAVQEFVEQRDARQAAEAQRRADEQAADEQADREVPPDLVDALGADDEVADLERRIAAGDETVTAEQLTTARQEAAGKVRFARLRQVAADRQARKETARAEAARVARAEDAAREALETCSAAVVAQAYDDAVAAVSALVDACQGRVRTISYLARRTGDDRLPGAKPALADGPGSTAVTLGPTTHYASESLAGQIVTAALRNAGVGALKLTVANPAEQPHPQQAQVPGIVTRGRADAREIRTPRKKAGAA